MSAEVEVWRGIIVIAGYQDAKVDIESQIEYDVRPSTK